MDDVQGLIRPSEATAQADARLIERWLPIAALGIESTRERTPMTPFPAPNRLHVWWARRPLVQVAQRCWPQCCPPMQTAKRSNTRSAFMATQWRRAGRSTPRGAPESALTIPTIGTAPSLIRQMHAIELGWKQQCLSPSRSSLILQRAAARSLLRQHASDCPH